MSEAKHTPGPWIYGDWITGKHGAPDNSGWVEVWNIKADGSNGLPFIACKHHDEVPNARLIAAAPEQHEALLATQSLLERMGLESSDEYQQNAAAISKATGGAK